MSSLKQRIRLRFSKQGDIRFISHRDLMRVFERALRRAGLPIAVSEGFNPRPRFSLPVPLSVGFTGLNEVADVVLAEWVRPDEVRRRLQAQLPDGITILSAEIAPIKQATVPELCYRIPLLPGHTLTEQKLSELMSCTSLSASRRHKETSERIEIRPYVKALRLHGQSLIMLLEHTQSGTARPQEVLEALGCREGVDYLESQIERIHVNFLSSP